MHQDQSYMMKVSGQQDALNVVYYFFRRMILKGKIEKLTFLG